MLADDPNDDFLNYALATEVAKEDPADGLARMREVVNRFPDYVAGYFKLAQMLAEAGDIGDALRSLEVGIPVAERMNDSHAAAEMAEFREMLRTA